MDQNSYSIRQQARRRREYLHRKQLLANEEIIQKNKEKVKLAAETGRNLPSHLRDVNKLVKLSEYDDAGGEFASTLSGEAANRDDEYRYVGVDDPKIVITTSRNPSGKLRLFAKELKLLFPNSQRINRGTCEIDELVKVCLNHNITDLILVHETRGQPDNLIISHLPNGPTAYFTLSNLTLRGDIPEISRMSEEFPHLMFENFNTQLGERVCTILRSLFPVCKKDSKKVAAFLNNNDSIVFRHYTTYKDDKVLKLEELGPRMHLFLYKIILGTISEEKAADTEYVYRPSTNTARKRKFLSNDPLIPE